MGRACNVQAALEFRAAPETRSTGKRAAPRLGMAKRNDCVNWGRLPQGLGSAACAAFSSHGVPCRNAPGQSRDLARGVRMGEPHKECRCAFREEACQCRMARPPRHALGARHPACCEHHSTDCCSAQLTMSTHAHRQRCSRVRAPIKQADVASVGSVGLPGFTWMVGSAWSDGVA